MVRSGHRQDIAMNVSIFDRAEAVIGRQIPYKSMLVVRLFLEHDQSCNDLEGC